MKSILCAFALLLVSISVKAQTKFCPPGATWNYLFTAPWPGIGTNNYVATYFRDSIIGTDTLKMIIHNRFLLVNSLPNAAITLIKQKGDTLFFNNSQSGGVWQILYNFGGVAGSSWKNTVAGINYTSTINSVSQVTVGGLQLKQLAIHLQSTCQMFGSLNYNVTERIIGSNFLFNFVACQTDGDLPLGLLCYKDNQIGTINLGTVGCLYSNPAGLVGINNTTTDVEIFPNPGSQQIQIKTNVSIDDYKVLNAYGQVCLQGNVKEVTSP